MLSALLGAASPRVDAVPWDEAGQAAVEVLARYLQIDMVNPPGHEDARVAFLGQVLDAEGLPEPEYAGPPRFGDGL